MLLNSTLEPGYPRKASIETARKWLHHLRFEVLSAKKGIFIGHERDDEVVYRKEFIRKIMIGFLHFTNAPSDESATKTTPDDIDRPTEEKHPQINLKQKQLLMI